MRFRSGACMQQRRQLNRWIFFSNCIALLGVVQRHKLCIHCSLPSDIIQVEFVPLNLLGNFSSDCGGSKYSVFLQRDLADIFVSGVPGVDYIDNQPFFLRHAETRPTGIFSLEPKLERVHEHEVCTARPSAKPSAWKHSGRRNLARILQPALPRCNSQV